jgi:hypothetical protein
MSTVQTGQAIISDRLTLIREVDVVEAPVAVTTGVMAGSISLLAFGPNSLIELISAGDLIWRLTV